jgi:hypothetical protein
MLMGPIISKQLFRILRVQNANMGISAQNSQQ